MAVDNACSTFERDRRTEIPLPVARLLGVPVWGLTQAEFLDLAFRRIAAREKTLFTTANAHSIVVAQRDPSLRTHFSQADAVLPDGFLAVLGARWRGGAVPERVAGPDFFEAFLARASQSGISVFFLGTTDATLARMRERARERFPGLNILGMVSPPFGEFGPEVDRALIRTVNAAHPDALFVAMTAPKQELWLSRSIAELNVPFAIGVGAAFDFFAGNRRRAPAMIGRIGGEWLFRLIGEPRRLWRRQLDSAVFLWLLATERFRGRSVDHH
jgi:N-acetylglucosaminyldiphosphoundecaprenol N-acetyl-beta-D-mannosaminyltransferase